MSTAPYLVRQLLPSDRAWVEAAIIAEWEAEIVIAHGEVFHPADLPGFSAHAGSEVIGLLTYYLSGDSLEVITLNSWQEGIGVGTTLLAAARGVALQAGCRRIFLVTTNNNLHALGFYQKRGFIISAVRLNALAESRIIKPGIPLLDEAGLPIRDEFELEFLL